MLFFCSYIPIFNLLKRMQEGAEKLVESAHIQKLLLSDLKETIQADQEEGRVLLLTLVLSPHSATFPDPCNSSLRSSSLWSSNTEQPDTGRSLSILESTVSNCNSVRMDCASHTFLEKLNMLGLQISDQVALSNPESLLPSVFIIILHQPASAVYIFKYD